jgi:hypothetical protein
VPFHRLPIVEIPFHDQRPISVHVDVPRTVVSDPTEEDIAASADLRHAVMLPQTVTLELPGQNDAGECAQTDPPDE